MRWHWLALVSRPPVSWWPTVNADNISEYPHLMLSPPRCQVKGIKAPTLLTCYYLFSASVHGKTRCCESIMDEGAVISDRGDYSAWMIRYQDYQVSTHCAVSLVTRISQSEASIQRVGQWESPHVTQVSPADNLSLTQELSTPHRSVSLLITLPRFRKQGESWPWMWIWNTLSWWCEAMLLLLTVPSVSSLHYNHYTSIHTITSCM